MDTDRAASIADIPAGYIDKENELIYGLQNSELFRLSFMPKGGARMAETALKEHGYTPDPLMHEIYTKHVTTVNDGIFRAYTSNILKHATPTVTGCRCLLVVVLLGLCTFGPLRYDFLMKKI